MELWYAADKHRLDEPRSNVISGFRAFKELGLMIINVFWNSDNSALLKKRLKPQSSIMIRMI